MKVQTPRVVAACAAIVGLLATAGTAHATVDASHITSPTSPAYGFVDNDSPGNPTVFTVTGTTTGTGGDVDLRCYYATGPNDYENVAANPATVSGGAFSVPIPANRVPDQPCRLRAVPDGDVNPHPPADTADPFGGPVVADSFKTTYTFGTSPYDFDVSSDTIGGYFDFESAGDCGLDYSYLFSPNTLQSSDAVFDCNGALYRENYTSGANSTRSEIRIDGVDAYDPASATYLTQQLLGFAHPPLPGQPSVTMTTTQDPATGLVEVVDSEPIVACSPGGVFPPTTASCTSFVPTGVELDRTWTAQSDNHRAVGVDSWRSTTGGAHALDALYDNEFNNDPAGAFRFPGDTGFADHAVGDQLTLTAGPSSIYYKVNASTPDAGDGTSPQGALTYSSKPDGPALFTYSDIGGFNVPEFELPYQRTIPAMGALTLGFAYSQAFALGDVQTLAHQAEAAFTPAPPPTPTPTPTPAPTPTPHPTAAAALSLVAKPTVSHGKVVVKVKCTGNAACGARATLTVTEKKATNARNAHGARTVSVSVGLVSKSVPAGSTVTIKVGLNAAGRKLLKNAKHHRLSVRLTVTQRSPGTAHTVKTAKLTVKATTTKKH